METPLQIISLSGGIFTLENGLKVKAGDAYFNPSLIEKRIGSGNAYVLLDEEEKVDVIFTKVKFKEKC